MGTLAEVGTFTPKLPTRQKVLKKPAANRPKELSLASSTNYQFSSSQESIGTDTMDPAPSRGSSEHLQTEEPSTSTANVGPHIESLTGPPGLQGNQFVHTRHHDNDDVPENDAQAKLRKKFKTVLHFILENRTDCAGG